MTRSTPPVVSVEVPEVADVGMKTSVGRRIVFATSIVAVVLAGVAYFGFAFVERDVVENVAAQHVGLLAEAVAASYQVSPGSAAADPDDEPTAEKGHQVAEILSQLARAQGIEWIGVLDHDGVVRRSTRAWDVGKQRAVPKRLHDVEIDKERDEVIVSYAMPFTQSCVQCHAARHDPVGVVQVAVGRDVALAGLQRFHFFNAIAVAASFAILVVSVYWLTKRLVGKPADRLARVMRRAEKGDFLVRARIEADDEIGALARAFNQMLRAVTTMQAHEIEREAQLREANAELSMKGRLEDIAGQLQASNEELERRFQGQSLLMDAAHRLGSTLDKKALLERLARLVEDKLGRRDFAVFLVEEGEDHEAILRATHLYGALNRTDVRDTTYRIGEGLTGLVADTGAPVLVDDVRNPPPAVRQQYGQRREVLPADGSLLIVPMLHKGRVVGVLHFHAAQPHAFDAEDVALLQALGAQAAMAVVNADLYQTTLELSVTDSLTRLMNRRALNRILEAELVRAQRFGTPLTVLMIDVDHFKQYNDRMGHLLGDDALRMVAQVLQGSVRKVDAVARFGGEEFCVVLPSTDEASGVDVADKLLRAVRALQLPGADNQPLGSMSISVGVAVYPHDMPAAFDGPAIDVILAAADAAAYEAKHRGRDQLATAGDVTGRPRRPRLNEPTIEKSGKILS